MIYNLTIEFDDICAYTTSTILNERFRNKRPENL